METAIERIKQEIEDLTARYDQESESAQYNYLDGKIAGLKMALQFLEPRQDFCSWN